MMRRSFFPCRRLRVIARPSAALLVVLWSVAAGPSRAQHIDLASVANAGPILDLDRPRLAVATDGSSAIAVELLSQDEFEVRPVLKVAVQRYSQAGTRVGPLHVFKGESCSTLDLWSSDYMSHAELAFRPDGVLVVLMQHTGRFTIGTDDVGSSEVTLAAIDPSGQVIDLHNSTSCSQFKVIFVGAGRQDRPQMALAPDGSMLITADGFFNGSDLRNVGIRVLSAGLETVFEQGIPHADMASEGSFHMYPDIATNGTLAVSTWQRCPVIDNQGNAAECDVEAQFITSPTSAAPQTLGGNISVSTGDPAGTISIWPSAAMNAAGASVIVWADTRTSAVGEVYGQRFDPSGQPAGVNFAVSTGDGLIYTRPETAVLDDGRFMVVWTDSSASGFTARARRYAADGSPEGPPYRLVDDLDYHSGAPAVTAAGSSFETIWLAARGGETPTAYSSRLGVVTDVSPGPGLPLTTALSPAYPNPASHETAVDVHLAAGSHVTLRLYDILGRQVDAPVQQWMPAGVHQVRLDVRHLPAGVYFCRLETETHVRVESFVRSH